MTFFVDAVQVCIIFCSYLTSAVHGKLSGGLLVKLKPGIKTQPVLGILSMRLLMRRFQSSKCRSAKCRYVVSGSSFKFNLWNSVQRFANFACTFADYALILCAGFLLVINANLGPILHRL